MKLWLPNPNVRYILASSGHLWFIYDTYLVATNNDSFNQYTSDLYICAAHTLALVAADPGLIKMSNTMV